MPVPWARVCTCVSVGAGVCRPRVSDRCEGQDQSLGSPHTASLYSVSISLLIFLVSELDAHGHGEHLVDDENLTHLAGGSFRTSAQTEIGA